MTSPARATEPNAIDLIEEAVHLLRRAPIRALAWYYLGSIPFIVALLFFWAYTTWFRPAEETLAWAALGLVALYVGMKVLQAMFCAELLAFRQAQRAPVWTWRRAAQLALGQVRFAPWLLAGTAVAAVLGVPFGWMYAYGQVVTVLGDGDALHREAVTNARRWPGQNHLALVLLGAIGAAAWLNLATAFYAAPWLANRLLGIDNLFGLTGTWFFNTTFLASVTALAWLMTDPLVKAFYTLWVFHGRARLTGDDIRIVFETATRARGAVRLAASAAAVVLALAPAGSACLRAADRVPPAEAPGAPAVAPQPLNEAIGRVLERSEFAWRLRPLPRALDPAAPARPEGPLARFAREGLRIVRQTGRAIAQWIGRGVEWLLRRFAPEGPAAAGTGMGLAGVRALLYLFLGAAVLLLLWVGWLVLEKSSWRRTDVVAAEPVAAAAPDLRDEAVHAAQLPLDGWLALAHAELARGEWRLAWRALYLATLAGLAGEGLISLAVFKTNLDYERELRRRALARSEVVQVFAHRRRAFEDVWYGQAVPGEADVRRWLAELERSRKPS